MIKDFKLLKGFEHYTITNGEYGIHLKETSPGYLSVVVTSIHVDVLYFETNTVQMNKDIDAYVRFANKVMNYPWPSTYTPHEIIKCMVGLI